MTACQNVDWPRLQLARTHVANNAVFDAVNHMLCFSADRHALQLISIITVMPESSKLPTSALQYQT